MSLKVFHVFFIFLAVLCTLGFAAWSFLATDVDAALKVAGALSGVVAVALTDYGYWFVTRKAPTIIT